MKIRKQDIRSYFILPIIVSLFLIFSTDCRKSELPADQLVDIEGIIYKTVKIGNQVWMSENLKTTRFNDGSEIPLTKENNSWEKLSGPGYCWYNNDENTNKDLYGALYNGFAVKTGKLCPMGWSVPDVEDFKLLRNFLGDSLKAGGKLKESGFVSWLPPNKGASNSSGFSAKGTGIRYLEGTFASVLSYTSLWSDTEIGNGALWYMGLYYGDASVAISHKSKNYGFSVRCLKN